MEQVDRRQFLQKAGVAGAAAGAVWVAPSVLGSSSAFAAGSCINQAALTWSTLGTGAGASNTGANVVFSANIPASGSSPAIHVRVTIAPVAGPGNGNPDGVDIASPFNGYSSFLKLSMTNNAANIGYNVTFDFFAGTGTGTTPVNVYNLVFKIIDIDRNAVTGAGFNDQVALATSGFTILSQGSEISGAGTTTTPWIGTNTGGITNDTGTVQVKYAGPVSSVTTQYRSREYFNGVQSIAFGDLGWCY